MSNARGSSDEQDMLVWEIRHGAGFVVESDGGGGFEVNDEMRAGYSVIYSAYKQDLCNLMVGMFTFFSN